MELMDGTMAADKRHNADATIGDRWRKNSENIGPTLLSAQADVSVLPLCAACPSARWFKMADTLSVYCREFHREMPSRADGSGVTLCDGYAIAIRDPKTKD